MKIEDLYEIYLKNPVISTDSRNIISESLFFALKGDKFNGNAFANEALDKGAAYAIIDEKNYKKNNRLILVNDVLETLQNLAHFHRRKLNIPIIAITGTNGKTTTKELLTVVLSSKYNVLATRGNLNNHIGVPLTLLSMDSFTKIGIVEMGANHVGEINKLCEIAEPNYGIITNIGKAHLEGFGSFENVIKAKTELYKFLNTSNGTIFFNSESLILKNEISKLTCKVLDYGKGEKCYCSGDLMPSDLYLKFILKNQDIINNIKNGIEVKTHLVGNYNFENALAALCVGLFFEVSPEKIVSAISGYEPSNNRSQFIKTADHELVLDFYNANPSSMEAALVNFNQAHSSFKKVIILGEMLELGDQSYIEHSKLLNLIKELGFKDVLLVGNEFMRIKNNPFRTFENAESLKKYLEVNAINHSTILIKGSRGVKLEKVAQIFDQK